VLRFAMRARGIAFAAALATAASVPVGAADDAAQLALGKTLFTVGAVPPCAICHTLKDAATTGAVGPVLDDLQPDADRVVAALKNGIGAMPSYSGSLSDEQMRALARYVAKASGATR
jgi:cytochrome c6